MKKRIYIDMDEVLVDTHTGLMAWHGIKNDPYKIAENCGNRNTHKMINMSWYDCWYKPNYKFWESLPPMPWAKQLVELSEEFTPGEVYFLTSPVPNGHCSHGKQLWVNQHFPKHSKKLIIAHCKYAVVDTNSILLDDSYSNEKKFIDEGKANNFYLFPSLMNNRHLDFPKMIDDNNILLNEVREVLNERILQSTCA